MQAPEEVDPWHLTILETVEYGNNCIQPSEMYSEIHPQSENCLFLNVFVPG